MTMITGDYGGIIFCANSANSQFYYFSIGRDGLYFLARFVNSNSSQAQTLGKGAATFIHTGPNQSNLLASVVHDGTIDFYVNQQKIGSVNDDSYTHGQIGVFAGNAGNPADVEFRNVKVWTL